MKLVVETLYESLEQDITLESDRRIHIGAIIPYLYFHNLSSGLFKFQLIRNSSVLYEHLFSWEDIKAGKIDNYMHVYHPIVPVSPIQLESDNYKVKIMAVSGYQATGNSFLGWIKQHEDIQLPMDYTPISDIQNTFTIRFKEYKEGIWQE